MYVKLFRMNKDSWRIEGRLESEVERTIIQNMSSGLFVDEQIIGITDKLVSSSINKKIDFQIYDINEDKMYKIYSSLLTLNYFIDIIVQYQYLLTEGTSRRIDIPIYNIPFNIKSKITFGDDDYILLSYSSNSIPLRLNIIFFNKLIEQYRRELAERIGYSLNITDINNGFREFEFEGVNVLGLEYLFDVKTISYKGEVRILSSNMLYKIRKAYNLPIQGYIIYHPKYNKIIAITKEGYNVLLHPHILNGEICLGDVEVKLDTVEDIKSSILNISRVLYNLNTDSPYKPNNTNLDLYDCFLKSIELDKTISNFKQGSITIE